jgi:pimeloyl-ACP methyl ester carboxylesterase
MLTGVYDAPEERPSREWPALVVCLGTAINPRYANRSLKRKLIRRFNRDGIPVVSFDFSGVGDSGGELRENPLLDIYRCIEKGCFVEDTLDALRYARTRFPSRRIILIGHCGGAITALHAAARDESITHLVLMELPVFLSTPPALGMDRFMVQYRLRTCFQRLKNPRTFLAKAIHLSNYVRLWSDLANLFRAPRKAEGTVDGLSAAFLSSFHAVWRRGVEVLCLFGEQGSGFITLYNDLFRTRYAGAGGEPAAFWRTEVLQNSGHIFNNPDSQERFLDSLESSLREWGIPGEIPSGISHTG